MSQQGNKEAKYNQEHFMAKAIHSMIRVMDEQKSVDFYSRAFGLKVAERIDFETFTLLYLRNSENDFELELTVNKGRETPYELGDGYGHLAFVVDDLDAEHKRVTDLGFAPRDIVEFKNSDTLVARFFFISDPDGYKIEVIERGGRYI